MSVIYNCGCVVDVTSIGDEFELEMEDGKKYKVTLETLLEIISGCHLSLQDTGYLKTIKNEWGICI